MTSGDILQVRAAQNQLSAVLPKRPTNQLIKRGWCEVCDELNKQITN